MALWDKSDILGLVISGILILLAGILFSSGKIDFITLWIMIIVAIVIPVAKLLGPFIVKDILKINEEKLKLKLHSFEYWKEVVQIIKQFKVGFDSGGDDKDVIFYPINQMIIQNYGLYVAEVDESKWFKTVSQGTIIQNNPKKEKYRAVIVYDLYSRKIVEENRNMDIEEWETKKFPQRAEMGFYSKVSQRSKIILPPNMAGMLPMEMFGGNPVEAGQPIKS